VLRCDNNPKEEMEGLRTKGLLILSIVFALVAIFYFSFEKGILPKLEEKKEGKSKVFKIDKDDLDTIEIISSDEVITLKKDKETQRWLMTSPVETETDIGEVESFISYAKDAEVKRTLGTVEDLGDELSEFGLEKPSLTVTLASGDEGETLLIGDGTPEGGEAYAMTRGNDLEGKVFLIYDIVLSDLGKDVFAFREKGVVAFSADDIKGFTVTRKGKTVGVEKGALGEWKINEPTEFPANAELIDEILEFVTDSEAKKFLVGEDLKLSDYGLDNPVITLVLYDTEGAQSTLKIGKEAEKGNYYAKREGLPWIFTVAEAVKNKLTLTYESIMDSDLFAYTVGDVSSFEISYDDFSISCDRVNGKWEIVKPEKLSGDKSAIDNTLWNFKDLRIQEIVEKPAANLSKYGLDNPTLKFSVSYKVDDEKRKGELIIGMRKGDVVYGYQSDRDIIFTLPSDLGGLMPTLFDLKDKSLLTFDRDDVESINISWDDEVYELTKKRKSWKMTSPENAEVTSENVKYLLIDVGDMAYYEVLSEDKSKIEDIGLDKPSVKIELVEKDGKAIGEIDLGEVDEEGGHIPAVSSSLDGIYAVDSELLEDIKFDLDNLLE
jgi:hypothetical protein